MNRRSRLVISVAALLTLIGFCATAAADQPFFKGMTVSCQTWGIEWQTPEMEKTLAELKSLGVDSIAIHPYAQIQEDGHVRFRRTRSTTYITTPLHWAHELGMRTMLIPHIAYWGTKFSWRGDIDFATSEEWDRFFTDYQTWIVEMARLAESEHAEIFCVGLEFSQAEKFEERWRKIIGAVRAVYHGAVTYGANWNDYERVKFWDAADYIGVLAYFPLAKSTNPTAPELSAAWQKRCEMLQEFSRQHGGKKFLFTEIGYNESARAAAEPWAFATGGEHAAEIQQRCIDAALSVACNCPAVAGMFWWKWFPEIPHNEEENYRLQTPEIKALLSKHWRTAGIPETR